MRHTELKINKFYYNDKDDKTYYINSKYGFQVVLNTGKLINCDMSYNEMISHDWTECDKYRCKLISSDEILRNFSERIVLLEDKLEQFDSYLDDVSDENDRNEILQDLVYDIQEKFRNIFEDEY